MKTKFYTTRHFITHFLILLLLTSTGLYSQTTKPVIKRNRPIWWVGESLAGNFNFYRGTTQQLNETVYVPTAFHNGEGFRLYFSFLAEYRKNKVFGGMLNVAFNNRSSSFDGVVTPANQKAFLYTVLRYVNIEPSIRIAPFSSAFYIFAGPTLSINSTREFFYEQEGQHEIRGNWGNLRKYVFGGQAGAGVDIPISKKLSANQLTVSPFVSYQTNFSDNPRVNESWNIFGFRTGLAVKFGTHKMIAPKTNPDPADALAARPPMKTDTVTVMVQDIQFSVRAPRFAVASYATREIFPLRNSIFFNSGSAAIPERYVQLSQSDARMFKESQLQQNRPVNWYNSQSERQLYVYHNILNILGDRLRNHPQSTIDLSTGHDSRSNDGDALINNIKQYLVTVFGIEASRITTNAGANTFITSIESGKGNDLALKQAEDRRVDITSSSPELLMPFGSNLAPINTPESMVVFTADGAASQLQSWSVDLTDDFGSAQHYGPYTNDNASVSAKTILGNHTQGNYTIKMRGESKNGQTINKVSTVSLLSMDDMVSPVLRYSVLFDFDRSKTIVSNERFLNDVVAPVVTDNSTVMIYGHTDIIGDESYNRTLSTGRVSDARQILEQALSSKGKKGVKFKYYGFGKDAVMSPFENNLPEERFYNRTVIIEIIQGK